jgi:hypothetical protein
MRPSNKSRSRNKSGGNQQRRNQMGNIVNRVFESAGPDGKVRGTPQQIIDKYLALARDGQVSGDRVAAENYLQHAEHYARLLSEAQQQNQEHRQQDRDYRDERDGREDDRQHDDRQNVQAADRQPADRDRQSADRQPAERQPDDRYAAERQPERQEGDRPNGQHAPQMQRREQSGEPAGLATFGGEDTGESGPVETPEATSWQPAPPSRPHDEGGQAAEAEGAEPTAAPAPKRTRSRRKTKPAAEVIEASAE